jgi:hypothetical protein
MEASQSAPCPAACKPLQGGQHLLCLIEVVAAGIDPKATPTPLRTFKYKIGVPVPLSRLMLDREVTAEKTKTTQAKPMTIWCLLVVALVMTFTAIGVALFFTPGHGQPLQKSAAPVVLTK